MRIPEAIKKAMFAAGPAIMVGAYSLYLFLLKTDCGCGGKVFCKKKITAVSATGGGIVKFVNDWLNSEPENSLQTNSEAEKCEAPTYHSYVVGDNICLATCDTIAE